MVKHVTEVTVHYQRKLNLGNFQTCDIGITLTASVEPDAAGVQQDIQDLLGVARAEVKRAAAEITGGKHATKAS